MSVVGFDIGNHSSYIAVARQGGVETATNDYSQRSTPTCVSFGAKSRCMGVSARQQVATNIKSTIFYFKHLIGRRFDDTIVQEERKLLNYELVELPEKKIGVKVSYLCETRVFTPEQILSIFLVKLKDISEDYLKTKISDCVISVPCYWTDGQRRSVLDAAKIADLNCLRLVNETTSVALTYGIYKQDLPEENEKAKKVVFVDIGHLATQIGVCAFNKGKLKMLGTVWDLSLGGRNFDQILFDFFNEEFKKKYKIDAKSQSRAIFRLLDECEKVKKQISANPNPIPLNIECFMNDKDVSATIKRADFEELCKNLWEKLKNLLIRVLNETGLKPGDVEVVELVGGSTRIPMIRQIILQIFGKEPCTTLNQDEAVSRGCALQCAILSPTFRVREFNVTDVQPFAIKLNWKAVSGYDEGEMEVFTEHHPFPFSKMLTFYRKEPFVLDASYAYPNHIPFKTTKIGQFVIHNVVPGPDGDNSKIKVKVRINANGIFTVTSALLYEQLQKTEDEQQQQDGNEQMDAQEENRVASPSENAASDATAAETMQTDNEPAKNAENGEIPPTNEQQQQQQENPGDKKESVQKSAPKPKPKIKSIDLPIKEITCQMTDEDIKKFRNMELELQKQDRFEQEKADSKNALEEYVYEMRNNLSEKLRDFMSDQDRKKFITQLEDIGNWLYEEGDDQPKEVYVEKLSTLKKIGDPVWQRYYNSIEKPPEAENPPAEPEKMEAAPEIGK